VAQQHISFDSFTRESNVNVDEISYNELIQPINYDADGKELPEPDVPRNDRVADVRCR
jgi:hypothetical protein